MFAGELTKAVSPSVSVLNLIFGRSECCDSGEGERLVHLRLQRTIIRCSKLYELCIFLKSISFVCDGSFLMDDVNDPQEHRANNVTTISKDTKRRINQGLLSNSINSSKVHTRVQFHIKY